MNKEIVRASAPKSDMMVAAPVSDRVQIKDVALVAVTAKYEPSNAPSPGVINTNVRTESVIDSVKNTLVVTVMFSLQAHHKDTPKVDFLSLDTVFRLVYTLESVKGISQEQVDAFGQANGVFNAWPYWREYVQSTTVRMGLPPLVLPVFRISSRKPKAEARVADSAADRPRLVPARLIAKR